MTNCVVCGAPKHRRGTTCAACGADLESYRAMNDSIGPERIPVRRYGIVPPPAADGAEHEPSSRHTARVVVLLLLGLLGAGALALGVSGLLR
jgi:hypothetical protein